MYKVNEGIVTETTQPYNEPNTGQSMGFLDAIGGWLGSTAGTYLNSARDQWFAREGISNGSPSDRVPTQTGNAAAKDIAGMASEPQPFYKNPMVLAGGGVALLLIVVLVIKK